MKSSCFWLTGLSASGKTTLASKLNKLLIEKNYKTILLDGDQLRSIFNHDKYDRENRIKYGYCYSRLCKFLVDQNINVIIGIVGLFHELQDWNIKNISGYKEIFLDVPLSELERRDPKGLYRKFKNGSLNNIFGGSIVPEFPKSPFVHVKWEENEDENKTFKKICKSLNL